MAKQGQVIAGQDAAMRLDGLAQAANAAGTRGLPPVHLWNPPFCGDIDMRIAADGTWFYLNTPIGRPALVRLFSSILKREGERYFLVTPVEKVGIRVDDAPFLAVEMQQEGEGDARLLTFRTNVDEWIKCDSRSPLKFVPSAAGGLAPYLYVRADMWAKVTRSLYYDLVALGEERIVGGEAKFGVASGDTFFAMADAEQAKF